MMGELYLCQECADHNRDALVHLDRHLRCEWCGSDAVEPLERLLQLQRVKSARDIIFLPVR